MQFDCVESPPILMPRIHFGKTTAELCVLNLSANKLSKKSGKSFANASSKVSPLCFGWPLGSSIFSPSFPVFFSKCRPVPYSFPPVPTARPSPPMLLLFSSLFSPFPHFYSPRAVVSIAIAAAKSLPALSFLSFFSAERKVGTRERIFASAAVLRYFFSLAAAALGTGGLRGSGFSKRGTFFAPLSGRGLLFEGGGAVFWFVNGRTKKL